MKSNNQHQDIFMKLSEKAKKKGGSMGAVFKLIQDLAEFEEKIEECASAQEMSENKEKINVFVSDLDKMYEVLLGMAKEGISSLRNNRKSMGDDTEEDTDVDGGMDSETNVDVEVKPEPIDRTRTPVMINVPQIPKM